MVLVATRKQRVDITSVCVGAPAGRGGLLGYVLRYYDLVRRREWTEITHSSLNIGSEESRGEMLNWALEVWNVFASLIPIKAPVPDGVVAFGVGRRPSLQDSQEVKSCAKVILGITGDWPQALPHIAVILIVGERDNARQERLALKSRQIKTYWVLCHQ